MSTSRQKRTFVSGVLLLATLSLSFLREVDGLSVKTTVYNDLACDEESGTVLWWFGGLNPVDFNECQAVGDGTAGIMYVCDLTTGETGFRQFADETCTELESEEVTAPSCFSYEEECGGSTACGSITACSDDVASTISPNIVNGLWAEYNDAGCTDPTGDTVVTSGSDGECSQDTTGSSYGLSECRADGSTLTQQFSMEDDTCSGDVQSQITIPATSTEVSPLFCVEDTASGLYYVYISCTSEAPTLFPGTVAPAGLPTVFPPSPSPRTEVDVDTPAPTTFDDADDTLIEETPAPQSDLEAEAEDTTPAPTANVDDDSVDFTPAPESGGGGSRGVRETAPPTVSATSGESEETPSPIGDRESTQANGAAGTGSGAAAGAFALSCVIGLFVSVAM